MKNPRLNRNDGTLMCMDYLNQSIHNLERAVELINENNIGGKQFNYTNCPELAHTTNRLESLIRTISDKTYQKQSEKSFKENNESIKASENTLEHILTELKNNLCFGCTDTDAYECTGTCSECSCYAISEKEFRETYNRLKEQYK